MKIQPKYLFSLFALIIGLNILLPFNLTVNEEDGWELTYDFDIDSEEEKDSEEKEPEEEKDAEKDEFVADDIVLDEIGDILARECYSLYSSNGLNVFLEVETPPPNA